MVFIGRVKDGVRSGRSVADHVREARQAILQEPSSLLPKAKMALVRARQLLSPPPFPFTPHHTSNWHSLLPRQVSLLTIALAPKPHPSSATFLLMSRAATGSKSVARGRGRKRTTPPCVQVDKVCGEAVEAALEELRLILQDATRCVTLQHRREWWAARCKLNTRLQQCLESVEDLCLQWENSALSFPGPVLLILGRHLHSLPWECLDVLKDVVITRAPSLNFAAAHRMVVSYQRRKGGTLMGITKDTFNTQN